ncbi:uncharacterized protein LOC126852537 isoform X1 [Cataglyphis hispanica]|uniref:uncharacterized protein LOC126852537 isoform X1 n=1 Tax=Cataglyphis hispanica TaxID=1086592 RepID=UPI00217FCF24|nr:uncharacterized protein LOC126852537 isoform X1 [Cataglyphis hispanica]
METTPGSRNMLGNVSPSVFVLLFLTTLIAGGIIFLIRYAVSRRSRSSLEQDSSKILRQPSWSPAAAPLGFIPIPQEPPIFSHTLHNGRRIPLNKKRNKQVLLYPAHPWLTSTLRGHTGIISDMSFSNNGRYLASCADDRSLQPEEYVQNGYRHNSQRETSILSSSHSDVMPPSGVNDNRYQHGNQERNPEIQGQITIDNDTYRTNNCGEQIWQPMYFPVQNTYLHEKTQQKQDAYVNGLYFPHLWDNISFSTLCQGIAKYKLMSNDFAERGYPIELPTLPKCAMIKSITYPDNFTTAEEKNDKKDSDSGNCSSSSVDSTSECSESSSDECEKNSDKKKKSKVSGKRERKCVRCRNKFYVNYEGTYISKEHCVHHDGKLYDGSNGKTNYKYWTCCKNSELSPGCMTAKVHVWNGLKPGQYNGPLKNFVHTVPSNELEYNDIYGIDIYAIDCEMCFTHKGLELTKVTVIDLYGNLVYETLVKPKNKIIDYNTKFSGITEEQMSNVTMTLEQVQEDLLKFIHAETILLGHNLASDFRMLQLLHNNVVDTTMICPHSKGFPYCMALKTLARNSLSREIQKDTHDSLEDARTVVDIVLEKVYYDLTGLKLSSLVKKLANEESL